MSKIALLFSLLLLYSFVSAQTATNDIIILKNGSTLYGTIVAKEESTSVTLKISEETVTVIFWEDIKEIKMGSKAKETTEMPKKAMKLNLSPQTGVYKILQLRGGQAFTSVSGSIGYCYKNHAIGVGAAFQPYLNIGAIAPVYGEYRYEMGKKEKRIKPLILGQIGYGFPMVTQNARRDTIRGGLYWNVGLGYKEYTARKFQWTYGIVFLQQVTHEIWDERQQNWNPNTMQWNSINIRFDTKKYYNRVIISWGLLF